MGAKLGSTNLFLSVELVNYLNSAKGEAIHFLLFQYLKCSDQKLESWKDWFPHRHKDNPR